ncbi:hypothetical protein RJ641_000757 [Dillenia turbinata]|uniref:Hepatoma-derived growth factor-related protein 2-like n=1 Tax=Dillenia turbinata TaxID=194707 RepID=A0AAN8WCI5_9MAGN
MADFSSLSDSGDEAAVEEILAQAMDLTVLEQVAAINCSSFSHADSVLPSHLESRFSKLKSFPPPNPKSHSLCLNKTPSPKSVNQPKLNNSIGENTNSDSYSDAEIEHFSPFQENPIRENGSKSKSKSKPKPKSLSSLSRSSSSSSNGSLSPPPKSGCFWCSPKRDSRRKSQKDRIGLDWGKSSSILSDLSAFSTKEQRKMLKKAVKEEEKIAYEAEKIIKWAKQESTRIDVTRVEDELSDAESFK